MQRFRQEDVLRELLNDAVEDANPFIDVYEAGPDIFRAELSTTVAFTRVSEIFGTESTTIQLTKNLTINLRSTGYDTEKIRYIEFRVPSSPEL